MVPPSWRHDVDGPADLVEEVVRIHGLASVKAVPLPRDPGVAKPVLTRAQRRAKVARRALASRGFNECVSFSFIARAHAALARTRAAAWATIPTVAVQSSPSPGAMGLT